MFYVGTKQRDLERLRSRFDDVPLRHYWAVSLPPRPSRGPGNDKRGTTIVRICTSALTILRCTLKYNMTSKINLKNFVHTQRVQPFRIKKRDGAQFLILLHVNKYWTCCHTCELWIVWGSYQGRSAVCNVIILQNVHLVCIRGTWMLLLLHIRLFGCYKMYVWHNFALCRGVNATIAYICAVISRH